MVIMFIVSYYVLRSRESILKHGLMRYSSPLCFCAQTISGTDKITQQSLILNNNEADCLIYKLNLCDSKPASVCRSATI